MDKKNLKAFFARFLLVIIISLIISLPVAQSISYNLNYDANGNLIGDGRLNYEYNSENRLKAIKKDGKIIEEYIYDADGNRVKKIEYKDYGSTTTYYVGDFIRVVNSSGTFDTIYYYANNLVGRKDPDGKIYYYHQDYLGSTSLVTDESGNTAEQTFYKPFGKDEGGKSRFLFTGKEKDSSGLYYYGARYYSPLLRRFTQPDTILQDIYDPQLLNRYSYARNNPYKYVDPSGHFINLVAAGVGALMGAVIGAGMSLVTQVLSGNPTNWVDVGKSALIGGAAGAVGGATFGLGLAAYGTGLGGYAAAGTMTGLTAGRTAQLASNAVSGKSLSHNMLNINDMARDITTGAVLSVAGYGAQKAVSGVSSVFGKGKSKPVFGKGKYTLPSNPNQLTKDFEVEPKVTGLHKQNLRWKLNKNLKIERHKGHPFKPGDTYSKYHHEDHYAVYRKVRDPITNKLKWVKYRKNDGRKPPWNFLPGEKV